MIRTTGGTQIYTNPYTHAVTYENPGGTPHTVTAKTVTTTGNTTSEDLAKTSHYYPPSGAPGVVHGTTAPAPTETTPTPTYNQYLIPGIIAAVIIVIIIAAVVIK